MDPFHFWGHYLISIPFGRRNNGKRIHIHLMDMNQVERRQEIFTALWDNTATWAQLGILQNQEKFHRLLCKPWITPTQRQNCRKFSHSLDMQKTSSCPTPLPGDVPSAGAANFASIFLSKEIGWPDWMEAIKTEKIKMFVIVSIQVSSQEKATNQGFLPQTWTFPMPLSQ